jgi:nucleoside-diphosphate-sugar epimerase
MTSLVTGGTGFTGSHLVRRLLQRGDRVRVLDLAEGIWADELRASGAEITLGSVTDSSVVARVMAGVDRVFHLAAAFRQINLPDRAYWEANVRGTQIVGEAALEQGVRSFVYCSTQGVHGALASTPGDEQSPIKPDDYYQQTKYEGEQVIASLVARGLPATTLRPMAIYGPGDPARFLMLFRAAARGRFLMFGDGRTLYHPLYIDNLVDAFELAGSRSGRGEVLLIGDEKYCTLDALVEAVARSLGVTVRIVHLPFRPLWAMSAICEDVCRPLGVAPPLFRRRAEWFVANRAFRIDSATKTLGYVPAVDLATGLQRTADWYRAHAYL